jgi:hypothetical protein
VIRASLERNAALKAFMELRGAADMIEGAVSGQWRAMPHGIDGIPGNGGNVVSVTDRF